MILHLTIWRSMGMTKKLGRNPLNSQILIGCWF